MRWSKVKNALIAMLFAINIFLAVSIIASAISSDLSKEAIASAHHIFEKNSINIDEKIIPKKAEKRQNFLIQYYSMDYLTKSLFGHTLTYSSAENSISATQDGAQLSLSGNAFVYKTGKTAVQSGKREIISAVKKLGWWNEYAYYDTSSGSVKMQSSGADIDSLYLKINLTDKGEIAEIRGSWGKVTAQSEEKVSFITVLPNAVALLPDNSTVEKIEGMYIIVKSNKEYISKNAWRITADGQEYIVK